MKPPQGFSTIELLAALCIALPVLAALALALRGEVEAYRMLRKTEIVESALFRTEKLLHSSVFDSDSAAWAPALRIHKNGRIQYADGSANPVMAGTAALRPLPTSDALTSASFDPEHAFIIRSAHLQGRVLSVTACPRFKSSTRGSRAHSLLALGAEQSFELTSQERELTFGSACQALRLRSTKSMLTGTASLLDLRLARVLVPIVHLRTLYIDRRGELHHLAHRGFENIENQPLLRGLKQLHLAHTITAPWKILALRGEIRDQQNQTLEFEALSSLARRAIYNFSLNRP